MKICLINNLYKPFNRGGAEKITATIAQGLITAGHEVFIITTRPAGGKSPTAESKDSVRIYYLNSLYYNLNKLPKLFRFFWHIWNMFNALNYFKIKRILKKEKCQAVITNNLMGIGYLTDLAIRKLKLKQIHIVHDIQLIHPSGLLLFGQENTINGQWSRNYAGVCSRIFASPKIVIFPSRWLMNMHLDKIFFIKSKRIVLSNPVVSRKTAEPKKISANFKFLYSGQIEEHKGVSLLIQAFKKVKKKFPEAELIMAGRGSALERSKFEASQNENIKFLGRQDEMEVNHLLNTCDCLVLPTLCYENCPAAILEAFSAGLPVIAADLGGVGELIGETAGILFRPGNPADLADKMAWAMENKNALAEYAKAGKSRAVLCDVKNYIKELEGLMKL